MRQRKETLSKGSVLVKVKFSNRGMQAFGRFLKYVGKQTDPVMMLLRAHLYTEAVLGGIIRIRLPHGEVVNKRARLSYYQKLILVEALDLLDPAEIVALAALNTVRNAFAHRIDRELTMQDVLQIGNSLREKKLEDAKQQLGSDIGETLKNVLSHMCGRLDSILNSLEDASNPLTITKKKSP